MAFLGALAGCASPGPPRAPSLFLPRPVDDLEAARTGNTVELRFSLPSLSTDGQPLRARELLGELCRQEGRGSLCHPLQTAQTRQPLPVPSRAMVVWTDVLPPALLAGPPRLLTYRVQLRAPAGGTAGYGAPAFAAAGAVPADVMQFRAEGSRLGVVLRWAAFPASGEVVLERTEVPPRTAAPTDAGHTANRPAHPSGHAAAGTRPSVAGEPVLLKTGTGPDTPAATIDNNIEPGVTYRYRALRRERVELAGRTLELSSEISAPVEITWQDIYPPPPPTQLTALGFQTAPVGGGPAGYAVDLVWQPAEDTQLAGYLVYRSVMGSDVRVQLTPVAIPTPGFHDSTALPGQHYRYAVVAIGLNGHQSEAALTTLEP